MQRKILSIVFKQILMCILLLPMIASAHLIRIDSQDPFPASVSASSTTEATYTVVNISSIPLTHGIQDKSILPAGMSLLNSSTCSSASVLSPNSSCTLNLRLVAPSSPTTLSGVLREHPILTADGVQLPLSVDVTGTVQYTVTSSAGSNGAIAPSGQQSVDSGDNIGFTATPDSGYEVDEWSVDNDGVQTGGNTYQLSSVTANHTVAVTFVPLFPTVTSISPNIGAPSGGTSVIITGTHFSTATSVQFGNSSATSFTIDSDSQITAVSPAGSGTVDITVTTPGGTSSTSSADEFTYQLTYTVTSSAGSNGTIDPSGQQSVNSGSTASFTATPSPGYVVNRWFVDGIMVQLGGPTYNLTNVTADHTVLVTFQGS